MRRLSTPPRRVPCDSGPEFRIYEKLLARFGIDLYLAEPYVAWRGTNKANTRR